MNINLNLSKLNVYKNAQLPGTLWYHDHVMGAKINVFVGLHSFYIIRDRQAEKNLPKG
jgi:spore coat protein A